MPENSPPIYNDPAVPGTPTGVERPDGGDNYQRGDDYQYSDPYYDESGLQTGVGGKLNERVNVGLDPKMLDYTQNTYENSPYANRNYNVNAGTAKATTRDAKQNEMSAYHLEQMLASDSPLMSRARSQAMAGAGSRGLMNSSIAQGAAMGSMIDRAQPFALQDATSHGRAATESMAAQNQASLTNAQLMTQAGIAGMQAGASRDQQLLASELGGRQDLLRHALGMETREDQQKWQSAENKYQRDWQGEESDTQRDWQSDESNLQRMWQGDDNERQRGWQERQNDNAMEFEGAQNRLNEQFQWASNRQAAVEDWAKNEMLAIMNREGNREAALATVAGQIFGNPELEYNEQLAAWASAQNILGELHGGDEYDYSGPPYTDPGYNPPPTTSAQGMATSARVSTQNRQMNAATGQAYTSASSPSAENVTNALPPIL